jgi:hypothetical protein
LRAKLFGSNEIPIALTLSSAWNQLERHLEICEDVIKATTKRKGIYAALEA